MIGKRVDWPDGLLKPGEFARHPTAGWHACTPNGHFGNLSAHDVTEHDDGTITVSPSILVTAPGAQLWHGFLERGVWREC